MVAHTLNKAALFAALAHSATGQERKDLLWKAQQETLKALAELRKLS